MQSGQNILLYFYRSIIHGRASENHTFSDLRVFRHTCQMVFRSKKSVSNTYLEINMGREIKKGKSSVNMVVRKYSHNMSLHNGSLPRKYSNSQVRNILNENGRLHYSVL